MEFEVLPSFLDKKDPPEDKELYLIHYQKLYQLSLVAMHWATEVANAETCVRETVC